MAYITIKSGHFLAEPMPKMKQAASEPYISEAQVQLHVRTIKSVK